MKRIFLLAVLALASFAAQAQSWKVIATEGDTFTVLADSTVRYGADTRWVTRTISGTATCNVATFGSDPAFGTWKNCWRLESAPTPPPPPADGWACWPDATLRMAQTTYGRSWTWWCKTLDAAGQTLFWRQDFTVPNRFADPATWAAASARVVAAPDWLAQANMERKAVQKPLPAAGSQEEYELRTLTRAGCLRAYEPPYPPGASWSAVDAQAVCGPVPTAPPAPVEKWIVAPAAATANPPGTRPAYPWLNGVRGTTTNGRATSGSPCDAAVGAGDWRGVNARTDQVALCVRQ